VQIDVALVPAEARPSTAGVRIVIDEIRASTTITTLLDLGCSDLYISGAVDAAKRLAAATGSLLAGERHALRPPGFDYDNSPTILSRAADRIRGRGVILCTTNGTAVLRSLTGRGRILVGCIRNASAVAHAAVDLALAEGSDVQVVCAGQQGRFNIDDAVAAGVIVGRMRDRLAGSGAAFELTDPADAAVRLRESYPDLLTALILSEGGRTLRRIGQEDDIAFCAAEDASSTVPEFLDGSPARIGRLDAAAMPAPA
jgi:2-phosphosulfolactate phosphatase